MARVLAGIAGGLLLGLTVSSPAMAADANADEAVTVDARMLDMPLELQGRITRQPGANPELNVSGSLGPFALAVTGTLGATSVLDATITAEDVAVLLNHLELAVPLSGPLHVSAHVTAARDSFDIAADTTAGPLRVRWRAAFTDGAISFDATVADLAALGEAFAVPGLPATDLRLGGRLVMDGDTVQLENGRASLADATAQFSGRFADGKASGTASATGPRLAALGFDLPELPFRLSTGIELEGAAVSLNALQVEAGESDLTGSAHLGSRDPLKLVARLQSRQLDLTPWRTRADAQDAAPATGAAPREVVFDATPLPFDQLTSANVDLELDVTKLVEGDLQLNDLQLVVDLEDGVLDGRIAFRGTDQGQVQGHATLDASSRPARLAMQAAADSVRLNLMSGQVASMGQIPPVRVDLDLEAHGATPRDLAASATGHVLFTQGPGRIDMGAGVPLLTGDLLTQLLRTLNPFSRQTPYSNLECSIVLLALQDGAGQMPVMLMQDERIQVIGQGTLDLKSERLHLEFKTQPRQGIGVTADMFVTPFVMLSGTLTRPTLGVNKRGVLLHGGAAFLTGGLSLLGEALLNRRGAVHDQCGLALAEAEKLLEAH